MQKLIIQNDRHSFQEEVNKHLADGWTVVENTLKQELRGRRHDEAFYSVTESYAVFLEKREDTKVKKRLLKG